MAAIFAQHHCETREAGQLYAAWRRGSPARSARQGTKRFSNMGSRILRKRLVNHTIAKPHSGLVAFRQSWELSPAVLPEADSCESACLYDSFGVPRLAVGR
jgi:hypothetical protein